MAPTGAVFSSPVAGIPIRSKRNVTGFVRGVCAHVLYAHGRGEHGKTVVRKFHYILSRVRTFARWVMRGEREREGEKQSPTTAERVRREERKDT